MRSVLEEGTRVSAETSRRLACDASRVVMRHDGAGRVVEIGARTRTIPPALRRALHARDRGCRFPGCGVRFGQGHHLRHWAHGGPTTLSNLALLCTRHHRAVHEEGFQVARGPDGALQFRRPKALRLRIRGLAHARPRFGLSPDLGAAAPRGLADQSEARAPALASGEASFVTGSELVIDYRALIFTSGNIPSTSPFITGCWLPPTIRDFRVTCCSTYSYSSWRVTIPSRFRSAAPWSPWTR